MAISVLITGTTGMVGKGVLLECLKSDEVSSITVINRSSLNMDHPKLKEIIHQDFLDLTAVKKQFKNIDACFFCLGVSSFRMDEDKYTKLTYDLTHHFASSFKEFSPEATFCYVSGTGTDSSEKGRIMWARVKGRTENALLDMFKSAYMFRPGYIQPMDGIRSKTPLYDNLYKVFKPIYSVLKLFPGAATNTANTGKAMIRVAIDKPNQRILENKAINTLSK